MPEATWTLGQLSPPHPRSAHSCPSCQPPRMVMTFSLLLMNTSWVTGGEVPADPGSAPAVGPGQAYPALSQEEMRLAANCFPSQPPLFPMPSFLHVCTDCSSPCPFSPTVARLTAQYLLPSPPGHSPASPGFVLGHLHGVYGAPTVYRVLCLATSRLCHPSSPSATPSL